MAGVLFDSVLAGAAVLAREFCAIVNVDFTTVSLEAAVNAVTTEVIDEIDTVAMLTGVTGTLINVHLTILSGVAWQA